MAPDPESAVPTPANSEMLSMGLTFPSSQNGAASSSAAATTKGGYESPINGVVSDEDDAGDDDDEDDTDSTEDEEGSEARVEISRPAMTQSRMQERFQFSRLPSVSSLPGCQNFQGVFRIRKSYDF